MASTVTHARHTSSTATLHQYEFVTGHLRDSGDLQKRINLSKRANLILHQSCLPSGSALTTFLVCSPLPEPDHRARTCPAIIQDKKHKGFTTSPGPRGGTIEGQEDKSGHPFRAMPEKPTTVFSEQQHQPRRRDNCRKPLLAFSPLI